MKGIVIPVDGEVREVEVDGLDDMRGAIGCEWIEGVTLRQARMYVNEEGLLRGLPVNPRASALYLFTHRFLPTPIVGDALILGPIINDGEDSDIPPMWADWLTRA